MRNSFVEDVSFPPHPGTRNAILALLLDIVAASRDLGSVVHIRDAICDRKLPALSKHSLHDGHCVLIEHAARVSKHPQLSCTTNGMLNNRKEVRRFFIPLEIFCSQRSSAFVISLLLEVDQHDKEASPFVIE
ncbi:hypothetical protein AVEN_50250-1 [Araneus ventricosus]|uniref:Uncharacterized protein n=1 Tax=Araneus ventricosus TaxID=182803 RepID=A0A4Y2E781_ARAVE|nr:hypothetical protein AVEN_50250-1 [Araneus ventricosus]